MVKVHLRHPILESVFGSKLLLNYLRLSGVERQVPQLLASRKFHAELELEMLRSDRMSSPLTLLLFDVHEPDKNARVHNLALERLGTIVCQATRKTDSKGWLRDASGLKVALILFHTIPQRTDRIIQMIKENFRQAMTELNQPEAQAVEISCEIYAYPTPQDGNGQGRQQEPSDDEASDETGPGILAHEGPEDGRTRNPQGGLRMAGFPSVQQFLGSPLPFWKRTLDISVSSIGLLLVAPIFPLIALAIKLSSPGPVFFKQPRVGYLGRIFLCWKFRSMKVNADPTMHRQYLVQIIERSADGQTGDQEKPMQKLDATDNQITSIGRFLRVSCLDELPQLINVLRGEMSLVGPRPCLPYEAEKYQLWHNRRLDVAPGITGLWQVMGKNKTTFRQMIRFDIIYARQRSLWLDLKILFMTIPAVFHELQDWPS